MRKEFLRRQKTPCKKFYVSHWKKAEPCFLHGLVCGLAKPSHVNKCEKNCKFDDVD